MNPPLAKAKPISDSGSASRTMYLRKGKKNCSQRYEQDYMRGTTLQTPRSLKKVGEEVLQALKQRFPAAHDEDHGEAGCDPAAMEAHGGADLHL